MKYLHLIILILFTVSIFAITNEEIRFLCDKEQFQLLAKHYDTIQKKIKTGDKKTLIRFSIMPIEHIYKILLNNVISV